MTLTNGNPFRPALYTFLGRLAKHNERGWFNDHKSEYDAAVRAPALEFIRGMEPRLADLSPHFRAIARRSGGSLMRIYRDIRYSNDKTPYKTNVGIQFRHAIGHDVHAPGYYLHLAPGECFAGVGIWRPESHVLRRLRDFLADNPGGWRSAVETVAFSRQFTLSGESLIRPPRGYPPDHPLLEDLKRKDFIAIAPLRREETLAGDFPERLTARFAAATPFMRYLCQALELPF
jgi:uncharacterized protein (TIGR02453 family)